MVAGNEEENAGAKELENWSESENEEDFVLLHPLSSSHCHHHAHCSFLYTVHEQFTNLIEPM